MTGATPGRANFAALLTRLSRAAGEQVGVAAHRGQGADGHGRVPEHRLEIGEDLSHGVGEVDLG